jgi:hypothetical protein
MVSRTLWGKSLCDTIYFLGAKTPVLSQNVEVCRLSSLGKRFCKGEVVQAPSAPLRLAWCIPSWALYTHQVDAVGVNSAQGTPAQVSVIVFGICLHATGVIASGTAERVMVDLGSEWTLGWEEAEVTLPPHCTGLQLQQFDFS